MTTGRKLKISAILAGRLIIAIPGTVCISNAAAADSFDAGKVINEMSAKEQSAYIAGVVEGLAIARYMKDGKQKTGMGCIYDWYYRDPSTIPTIIQAFEKYPTYPPGSIVDVLVKKKCGE